MKPADDGKQESEQKDAGARCVWIGGLPFSRISDFCFADESYTAQRLRFLPFLFLVVLISPSPLIQSPLIYL